MLIVCPNCATSYGVEMASLRPAKGWTRKLATIAAGSGKRSSPIPTSSLSRRRQCRRCGARWPPLADAARSALPRLRRATAVLAEELETGRAPPDGAASRPAGFHTEPAGPELARAPVTPLAERISAIVARVVGAVRRQSWSLSWPLSWWRSWSRSWLLSWRHSWWLWRPSLSRVQCQSWRQAAVFCGIGGHVVGLFASRYSIGTHLASFSKQVDLTLPCPARALGRTLSNVGTQPSSGP